MTISTVIFDFGGTLIEPTGCYPEAAAEALLSRSQGANNVKVEDLLEFDDKVFRDMLDRRQMAGLEFRLAQYFKLIEACLGLRFEDDSDEIAFETWFRKYEPRLRDGADECLRELKKKGASLGLLSNTVLSGKSAELALSSLGVRDLFDAVLCSSDVAYCKPHAVIFRAILNLLTAEAGESAMVGDSLEDDIAGAAAYGLTTLWYNPDGVPDAMPQPDHIIADLRSVPEVLGFG